MNSSLLVGNSGSATALQVMSSLVVENFELGPYLCLLQQTDYGEALLLLTTYLARWMNVGDLHSHTAR